MPTDVLENFGSTTALTITLGSLASSTTSVGRQTTEVDNTTTKAPRAFISAKITLGTSPTANTAVYFWGIRNDNAGTAVRDDGAGASDAAWTRKSAKLIGVLYTGASPSTGDVLTGVFVMDNPGKKFAVGVTHNTGVALNSTGSNHVLAYHLDNPQAQ